MESKMVKEEAGLKTLESMERELEKRTLDVRNLSLVEHAIIGSSWDVHGELWDSGKYLDALSKKKI